MIYIRLSSDRRIISLRRLYASSGIPMTNPYRPIGSSTSLGFSMARVAAGVMFLLMAMTMLSVALWLTNQELQIIRTERQILFTRIGTLRVTNLKMAFVSLVSAVCFGGVSAVCFRTRPRRTWGRTRE